MKKAILAMVCVFATVSAFAATPEEVKRETPKYDKAEEVIEKIAAQYPGKTVFVDLWATWCGPCIRAMETMKPVKSWMKENDIVSAYVTGPSSDPEKWNAMIGDIGGNHYLLTEDEWKAVMQHYGIKGIPTYIVFDKKGEKSFQQSGYPGNEKMQEELEKANN